MARSRAVSQAFHVLVADYLFHPHGSLGMPYFERGALHDVVLVLEPREEAREYALDVVCHDLADAVLLLVVHEISVQRFCVYLGERYVNGFDEVCEGRLVISERSLRTPFELLGTKEGRKQLACLVCLGLCGLGRLGHQCLGQHGFLFFELQRAEELLHGR